MMEAKQFLQTMLAADRKNGNKLDKALDAISHFFFRFPDCEITNAYRYRWTNSLAVAEQVYVSASKYLFDREFEIIDIMDRNKIREFLDFAEDLQKEMEEILK
jgi:hypothetical protein